MGLYKPYFFWRDVEEFKGIYWIILLTISCFTNERNFVG